MPGGTRAQTRKAGATCGATKRSGGKCTLAPGWGTIHPGIGKCKLHGGSVPNHIKAAAKDEHRKLLGHKREIDPHEAIIECIQLRAGEVQWLSEAMADLDKKDWVENTIAGKQFHLYARERQAAMNDLVRFSQIAISLGIAERHIKMVETYGELLAGLLRGVLDDLWPHLDADGRAKAPAIVRQRMLALDASRSQAALPPATAAA
jgi:hypothetical protein